MKKFLFPVCLVLLFAIEVLRVYFIMPFPGSQRSNTIDIAYFLHNNIWWIRLLLLVGLIFPLYKIFVHHSNWKKILSVVFLLLYGYVFYMVNTKLLADKMFYQPKNKILATSQTNTVAADQLVIGISLNGQAKCYPIEIIGYHHQVQDTIGGIPVIVTYCTVCRTGRVYSPVINGKTESFRLVGMDHFNAMFEDATTKSWWRQVSGEAIAGKLKGQSLTEIPSQQTTLSAWLRSNPASLILQPDTLFKKDYKDLKGFDKGTIESSLEKRDSASWQMKSWVIGISVNGNAKAYDWNKLIANRIIQDSMPSLPLLITVENDTATYHVLSRTIKDSQLQFVLYSNELHDTQTHSVWNMDGFCTDGFFKGIQLRHVQSYQEFWHSWQTFHPNTIH